jgi:ubiquinone/menaquinone biosynthesis C-methylase UbiE
MTPAELTDVLGAAAGRLRCLVCGGRLGLAALSPAPVEPGLGPDGELRCKACSATYPLSRGTVRMLPTAGDAGAAVKQRTGQSFAYEWAAFGGLRPEWQRNFEDYLRPHQPADLDGLSMLDVGTGSGRHAYYAARAGAQVVAVDVGGSIDVARRNLPRDVLTVQADAEHLPFDAESFDMVMSIGVLHHLPDPEGAVRAVARYVRPGGWLHLYLYWWPERAWQRAVLRGVSTVRRVTTRLPHPVLHALCYPLAAVLYVAAVVPYRLLREAPGAGRLAAELPLKTYADYPFGVLVNDQFDRFSAPIEHRFHEDDARALLEKAGCTSITTVANSGWVLDGVMRGRDTAAR